jgi:hypothetical protein
MGQKASLQPRYIGEGSTRKEKRRLASGAQCVSTKVAGPWSGLSSTECRQIRRRDPFRSWEGESPASVERSQLHEEQRGRSGEDTDWRKRARVGWTLESKRQLDDKERAGQGTDWRRMARVER